MTKTIEQTTRHMSQTFNVYIYPFCLLKDVKNIPATTLMSWKDL